LLFYESLAARIVHCALEFRGCPIAHMLIPIPRSIEMSEHQIPEPKPDLMLKAWGILVTGKASAVLLLVGMMLIAWVVVKLFGH
jgi:hypothetical protein